MKHAVMTIVAMAPLVACAGTAPRPPATASAPAPADASRPTQAPPGPAPAASVAASPGPPTQAPARQRELVIGDHRLPGILTLPRAEGPFAAVVLVHGSGPSDRDETIGPNKPFQDLAAGLASHGIATLRYDKRTLKFASEFAPPATYTLEQEVLADARAAVAVLAATPEIDRRRIFVLGHSLGGTLAPRIAAHESRVAGLIILAGATRPFDELVVEQIKTAAPGNAALAAQAARFAAAFRDPALAPGDTIEFLGAKMSGSYCIDLRSSDPAATAATLRLPMLILQGERDYQVTMADLDGWKRALAGRSDVMFRTYASLNHLFMAGTGPASPADYQVAGHVAAAVIDDIAGWLAVRTEAR